MFGIRGIINNRNKKKIYAYKDSLDKQGFFQGKQVNEIKETKYGEIVIVSYPENSDNTVNVYLTCILRRKRRHLRMYLNFNEQGMQIADIQILRKVEQSRGYGELMMETALHIAAIREAKTVFGDMVSDNDEQRVRQINYYSKYGFTISPENQLLLDLRIVK
ncbi:hypothetical protein [Viridibacillus arvi]|uniref:hypothetical protein n=1 Tax=Viridibacillus arvi TaxID=263475 RepID=UPI003D015A94